MKRELQATDIMQANVVTVSPEMSLLQLRDIFARHRIAGAPVVSESKLVGAVSQADLLRVAFNRETDDFPGNSFFLGIPPLYTGELSAGALDDQLREKTVSEAMTTDLYTVSADDRLAILAVIMRHHRIQTLIVTNAQTVVGLVTALDLIQVLENH